MDENEGNVIPKCTDMCPSAECLQRQRQNLIHILETDSSINSKINKQKVANPKKMVKTYCRSAAGQNLNKPELLRPPLVLMNTVNYIIKNIIDDQRVDKTAVYDFVNDRFRSVKQDGVIQRMSTENWFQILPPVMRYYALSAYWFCEDLTNCFDPKLNQVQLIDCLLLLIEKYERNPISMYAETYAEAEALYLIIDFKPENINRAVMLNLPNRIFQDTLKLITKWYTRKYYSVFRKLAKLPLLPACLFTALHLTTLRKDVLEIMSAAYCSKNVYYPSTKLISDLLYNSEEDGLSEFVLYGIILSDDRSTIQFKKSAFPNNCVPCKRMKILDDQLKLISPQDLLLRTIKNDTI